MKAPNQASFIGWTKSEPFIFVSYARENGSFVYPEIDRLKAVGYRVWYDKEQIRASHSWSNEIKEALEACACFLVFITRRSVESERVICEIREALALKKPVVAIYWQKVLLPPDLHGHLQTIQGLEFYDLHRPAYEAQLGRALSELVEPIPPPEQNDPVSLTPDVVPSDKPAGISPKLICFLLLILGAAFSGFAIVTAAVPFFGSQIPGDPLNNRLGGVAAGSLFLVIAIGLWIAAFAVYRKHLRRK